MGACATIAAAGWLCLGWFSASLANDSHNEGQFVLAGVVQNSVTRAPIARALVTVTIDRRFSDAVLTDSAGAFRIRNLPAGTATISVSKAGFVGEDVPAPVADVTLGPSREDLVLVLDPLGSISGKITDQNGEPVPFVRVDLFDERVVRGRLGVYLAKGLRTNDRGEFRVYGLTPGRYFIRVVGPAEVITILSPGFTVLESGAGESFAPVYYPGVADLRAAKPIVIGKDTEARADLVLKMLPARTIAGEVKGISHLKPPVIELLDLDGWFISRAAQIDPYTGSFRISGVGDGAYIVRVHQGEGAERLQGEARVEVKGRDVSGLQIRLLPPPIVRVSLRYEIGEGPGGPPKDLCTASLRLPRPLREFRVTRSSDTSAEVPPGAPIQFKNLTLGDHEVHVGCPSPLYLASLTAGDKDLLADPVISVRAGTQPPDIEGVIKYGATAIRGMVISATGPAPFARLLLVRRGEPLRPPREEYAHVDGQFDASGLEPGDYYIVAFPRGAQVKYADREVLRQVLRRAETVRTTPRGVHKVILNVSQELPR